MGELKKLKEKQAKRKEIRAEQEKKLNQAKKEEEEKLRKEEADKRAAEAEEKKKRLEEAEAKRQEMLDAQKADKAGAGAKKSTAGTEGNDVRKEMTKTKEQLEEEKKIALSIRIKPLDLADMDTDDLKAKATELFNIVIQLETDKYDYEQKRQQQERDLQELKERQKAQLRQKALKKGLDPEALVGKYPPHDPHVLQVREEDRHQDLRGQEEAVRGRLGGHPCRVPGRHLEGEVRRVVQEAFQEASQVVRREARQEGWRCRDSRG